MKVFLSWSGELSNKVAGLMNDWICNPLQGTEGWFSPDDIEKGSIWFNGITDQFSDTSVGIIFCTKENLNAPWLLFEAGALSKGLAKSRVIPFLIDLKSTDLHPPLSQFNATICEKDDVLKLLKTINSNNKTPLGEPQLSKAFEMWWPEFEEHFQEILKENANPKPMTKRSTEDYLEEILLNTRAIFSDVQRNNAAQIEPFWSATDPSSGINWRQVAASQIPDNISSAFQLHEARRILGANNKENISKIYPPIDPRNFSNNSDDD